MIIKDRMELNGFNRPKFPKLKGHVKVTLHNVHNGKNEVIEGENIVTNAVADIMANNYLGGIDYSKMMPLWSKWFGGVLCYEKFHTNLDADKYYPYSESNNHLVAHAGQQGIDVSHDDDMRAGNPTTSSYIQTENSMKQVFEWGTTHGNGTIRALSLTHTDVGDAGLGGENYKFQNLDPFVNLASSALPQVATSLNAPNNLYAQYDDNHGLYFEIGDGTGEGAEGFYPQHTRFQTNKLTVYVKRLPYSKAGLFETLAVRTDFIRSFTVELEDFDLYLQPCYHFDYANKRLWIFSNVSGIASYNSSVCNYAIIDCENEVILTEGTLTSDTANLAPIPYQVNETGWRYADSPRSMNIINDGTHVWLPTTNSSSWNSNVTGFKKIRISDSVNGDDIEYLTAQTNPSAVLYAGDFRIMSGRVVNGDVGYTCVDTYPVITEPSNTGYTTYSFHEPYKPVSFATRVGASQNASANQSRFILANKLLNTTKYNLPSAITKTASQSMTVEYTLTEVS